jgi:hypothetical protein
VAFELAQVVAELVEAVSSLGEVEAVFRTTLNAATGLLTLL